MYGATTKKNWRAKGAANRGLVHPSTKPGEHASVDQLESTNPGFVAQIKEWLIKFRYRYATIFLDHYSSLSYIHLQCSTNGDETLDVKKEFEAYARSIGVDNGRFAERKWTDHVQQEGQTISYCAAYAHFQNGKAEKRIRDIQEQARKILLHAINRWPQAINVHIWPYDLRHANDVKNSIPNSLDGSSPTTTFSQVHLPPTVRL